MKKKLIVSNIPKNRGGWSNALGAPATSNYLPTYTIPGLTNTSAGDYTTAYGSTYNPATDYSTSNSTPSTDMGAYDANSGIGIGNPQGAGYKSLFNNTNLGLNQPTNIINKPLATDFAIADIGLGLGGITLPGLGQITAPLNTLAGGGTGQQANPYLASGGVPPPAASSSSFGKVALIAGGLLVVAVAIFLIAKGSKPKVAGKAAIAK